MTDPTFDELASAHLDGATTPAEAARIAADPALQARVEELRRVRAAVAQVPAADPSHRDAAIAAALAAFTDDDTDAADPTAPVSPLATASARRGPSPTVIRVLGAAAAVALLALLVPVLGRLAPSGDDDSASFDATGDAIEGGGETEVEDDHAKPTSADSSGEADLGTFEDLPALLAAVAATDGQASSGTDALAAAPEEAAACPLPNLGDTAYTGRTEWAHATVAGEAVIVTVRTDRAGTRTVFVYQADDCALLAEHPL
jgi:hypothetical protein